MIIGNGMLAKAFKIYENINNILIFASGISNSQEQTDEPFEREKNLLEKTLAENQTTKFIYFSTCSIEDPSMSHSRYVKHKLNMENLIQTLHPDFYIFRLSQVIGKTNSPTIIHYFYNKIIAKESFEIWNKSTRNLIDVDDIVRIVQKIINESLMKNKIINIASPASVDVPYIVRTIENILKIEAQYASYDKGAPYSIDISPIKPIMEDLAIKFDDDYLEKTIRKYYDNHEISI
jgi:nucleoside-diphosphate-sugar epimerase